MKLGSLKMLIIIEEPYSLLTIKNIILIVKYVLLADQEKLEETISDSKVCPLCDIISNQPYTFFEERGGYVPLTNRKRLEGI